jgi:hypothetical protein
VTDEWDATRTLIALMRTTLDQDHETGGQIVSELTAVQLVLTLGIAVGMLVNEIDSACRCCVGLTIDEYIASMGQACAELAEEDA